MSGPDKSETLDFDTICQCVDDAAYLGAKLINLSGGEPMLRPDIARIADYIHNKGLKIRLYCSGIYYDGSYQTMPIELLESIKGKVDNLILNYESCCPELYSKIMGTTPDNLALLEETIKNAIQLGITVEAHIVPMKCNYRQIPETLTRLYSMGVSNISLLRLVPQGRVKENEDGVVLSEDEEQELKTMLVDLSRKFEKTKLRLGKPYRSEKYVTCKTGTVRLVVRYDGYVFPCGAFKDGMEEYGGCRPDNVKEKRLVAIYETSTYIDKVRADLEAYYKDEETVTEPCFGQYCRRKI
jgi:pyrroloquinoline quinone biosynthesis protein E